MRSLPHEFFNLQRHLLPRSKSFVVDFPPRQCWFFVGHSGVVFYSGLESRYFTRGHRASPLWCSRTVGRCFFRNGGWNAGRIHRQNHARWNDRRHWRGDWGGFVWILQCPTFSGTNGMGLVRFLGRGWAQYRHGERTLGTEQIKNHGGGPERICGRWGRRRVGICHLCLFDPRIQSRWLVLATFVRRIYRRNYRRDALVFHRGGGTIFYFQAPSH